MSEDDKKLLIELREEAPWAVQHLHKRVGSAAHQADAARFLVEKAAAAADAIERLTRELSEATARADATRDLVDAQGGETPATFDPAKAPGMTDMMVPPETLDAFMEANPLPAEVTCIWDWEIQAYVPVYPPRGVELRARPTAAEEILKAVEAVAAQIPGNREYYAVPAPQMERLIEAARARAALDKARGQTENDR